MIVGNGVWLAGNPNRFLAAPLAHSQVRSGWNKTGALRNMYTSDDADPKDGIPSGMRHPHVWLLPKTGGGLASRYIIAGDADLTGNLAGGVNGTAAIAGVGVISTADGAIIAALVAALTGTGAITVADITAIVHAEILAELAGTGTITTANMVSLLYTAATLAGGGTIPTATLDALGLANADVAGVGALGGTARATGSIDAAITLGASLELSPDNLAAAVKSALMDTELDGYTVEDIIKLTSAVLLGKSSGGATNPVFRSMDDLEDRVTGEVDATGNRTDSILSP